MQLNAELFRELSLIAEDETMMQKVLKYVKKLTMKKEDPTLMTKQEFFSMIERAEQAYQRGECTRLQPDESVTDMLRRSGYDL